MVVTRFVRIVGMMVLDESTVLRACITKTMASDSKIREHAGGESDPFSTSLSLLERAAANDQQAWRQLTDAYGPLIYHWCRKAGLGADDAADILQEVFRSLVSHLPNFRKCEPGDSFRAWLWTITRNKLRDRARVAEGKPRASGARRLTIG